LYRSHRRNRRVAVERAICFAGGADTEVIGPPAKRAVQHVDELQTVEHPFGTIKAWMGSTHFLTRTLKRVRTEMSLHILAYNIKRVIAIIGVGPLLQAIRA
jgi:hypothetical protein